MKHKSEFQPYAKLPAGRFLLTEWEACKIACGHDPTEWQWANWLDGLRSSNARAMQRERDKAALAAVE